jgi:hypothetical protein
LVTQTINLTHVRGAVDVGSDDVGQAEAARHGQGLRSGDDDVILAVCRLEAPARLLPLLPGVGGSEEGGGAAAAGDRGARLVALQVVEARHQVLDHLGALDVALQLLRLHHRREEEADGEGRAHRLHGYLGSSFGDRLRLLRVKVMLVGAYIVGLRFNL